MAPTVIGADPFKLTRQIARFGKSILGMPPLELSNDRRFDAMNGSQRVELLRLLNELGDRCPNWRFGQLVANVAGMADVDIWDIEDEQLSEAAKGHLERRANQQSTVEAVAGA